MTETIKDLIELLKIAQEAYEVADSTYCGYSDYFEGKKDAYDYIIDEIEEKLKKYLTNKEIYDIININ